jgi:hypothetical protein
MLLIRSLPDTNRRQERRLRRRPKFPGSRSRLMALVLSEQRLLRKGISRWCLLWIALVIALSPLTARAQTPDPHPPGPAPDPARPPLNPFPAEQNWSFLRDPAKRTDLFDPAKYIRFGDDPQRYLSLGFEYRIEYEYFDNWMFGAGPQDHNGYIMNRVMPHFDFHAGSDFRLFSEFEFDSTDGRNGGPRPGIDEDRGDVHQAFVEIGSHVSRPHGISLRAGRQEVVFGTGRLFDNNEGPNVKLGFDGFRAIAEGGHARLDLFAMRPVENNFGWFDDVPNHAQSVWGSYLTVPEARAAASRIVKDAIRATEIIKRTRMLFRKGDPQRELVDVNELIQELVVLLRSEAARYSISVRTEVAADLPRLLGDRVQLQQVLMNLVINGIEAMRDVNGARDLTINSQRGENGQLEVSVSDTGVGLPPDQARQIFNAFFTTKPNGTGMGLRISRSIVESHGGRLWAADNFPRGATFYVTLPMKSEPPESLA